MTFFDARGNLIEGSRWLSSYERYYFLGGPTEGRWFTSAYQTSPFVEHKICSLLEKRESLSAEDLKQIMAWKMGLIDHASSEASRQIKYRNSWNTALKDRYKRDFSGSISFLAAQMPTISEEVNKGNSQYLFDLHSNLDGFGQVYILTVLFFVSHGKEPIYDQFAHIAAQAIHEGLSPRSHVNYVGVQEWSEYEDYKKLLAPIARACLSQSAGNGSVLISRPLDRALWVYGHLFEAKRNTASIRDSKSVRSSVPMIASKMSLPGGIVRCFVGTTSQKGPDGLTGRVLYVCKGFEHSTPKLIIGQKIEIILSTPIGDFRARLRTESRGSDRLYVCAPLISNTSNKPVSLARVLLDCGIELGQEVETTIEGSKWMLRKR